MLGPDGKFAMWMERIFNLVLLHILWVVSSLPVVTIGASTTALFAVTLKMVRDEEGYIARSYCEAFRSNFKKSTIMWLVVMALTVWVYGIISFFGFSGRPLLMVFAVICGAAAVLVLLALMYLFPLQARYENTVANTMRNALYFGVRYLPYTLLLLLVPVLLVCLTIFVKEAFAVMMIFWILGGSSIIAYVQSVVLRYVFDKIENTEKKEE